MSYGQIEEWFVGMGLDDPTTLPGAMALAVLTVAITAVISRVLTLVIRHRPRWSIGKLERKVDPTVIRYVIHAKTLTLFLIAFIVYAYQVPALRALLGTVAAGAGITAVVVGFAARSTLSNIIAGLALAIYRPVRIGDQVEIEKEYGTVEDITLRHTIVRTWEHRRLIIPNEKLDSLAVVNYTIVDPTVLVRVELGVSYDTDLDHAKATLEELALECPYRKEDADEPWVRVVDHRESSIALRVYLWVADAEQMWLARFWLLENAKKRFDERGIEIPFPYRTVVYKKDLPPPVRGKG
jgi:small-conductance mechanosensitive channel